MKLNGLLLISIFTYCSCSNHTSTQVKPSLVENNTFQVNSIAPDDTNFSDLAMLKDAIGSSNIVLLGEQSHGGGSTYSAKVRLIKFLHQEMGFEIMAFESGMYDCAKIWQHMKNGKKMEDAVINSMFYMYATSKQVKPLFKYIDEQMDTPNPLLLCGMDSQHTGEKSQQHLTADLVAFLKKNGSETPKKDAWAVFERKVSDIIKMNRSATDQDKAEFYDVVSAVKTELKNYTSEESSVLNNTGFWQEIINSLESQAKRYWGDIQDMDRDRQMAANMSWLINNVYKGKKIIVWAHNFHIAKGLNPTLPMGHFLKEEFKEDMYAIGFTGYDGEFLNFANNKTEKIAQPASTSIEQSIKDLGWKYALVNFRNLAKDSPLGFTQKGRLTNFYEHSGVFPNIFDGLFYIETTTPAVRE